MDFFITNKEGFPAQSSSAATLVLDVEALLIHLSTLSHTTSSDTPSSVLASTKRSYLTAALSLLLPFGTNDEIDRICLDRLDVVSSSSRGAAGLARYVVV